jgi:muramidase (phage lysozyme)
MARIDANTAGGDNVVAFLDTIAWAELGPALLAESDDGYNVIVGSLPGRLLTFDDYAEHPRRRVHVREGLDSDAAGRYQFMGRYWEHYKRELRLPDFGPISQDVYAIQLIRECRALDLVKAGAFDVAAYRVRNIWASFPGAGYGQHEHRTADLRAAFERAGGQTA